jgi:hypothetical protein
VLMEIDIWPVVESGPFNCGLIGTKPKRFDQMQPGFGSRAKPGYITCVWMNLRLDKYNVKHVQS